MRYIALWFLLLLFAEMLLWQVQQRQLSVEREHLAQRATDARAILEGELNEGVYLTIGIESFLQSKQGQINEDDLRAWMDNLFHRSTHIRNIGLAPGNRLTLIYPLEGNEKALGLYYPDLKEQWPAVARMIQQRESTLDGPLTLKQGGKGIIYRRPVFIEDEYWGLISTVLNADTLLATVTAYADNNGLDIQLSRQTFGQTDTWQSFQGQAPGGSHLSHTLDLELPGAVWRLTVSQDRSGSLSLLLRLFAWLVVALMVFIVWQYQRSQARQREIEARNDVLKKAFVATVSHELRTPLTAIQGALGLVLSGATGTLDEKARTMLSMAQHNGKRLELLISDLLDLEKLGTGKMRLTLSWQPLWPILEQTVSENAYYAERKRVSFRLLPPDPDVQVNVDRSRLLQVLANLLSNGAKFSNPDSVVTLSARRANGAVDIVVEDSGSGVPAEFRPHLFEKFAQADMSDSRAHEGSGLGLSIAQQLVALMGGSIRYEPREPGSAFVIRLDAIQSRR